MEILSKEALNNAIGKQSLWKSEISLICKLDYIRGIKGFDNLLNGKTIKEYGAVIHLIQHPKGLEIKLAESFNSNSAGLLFLNIKEVIIENKKSILVNKDRSIIGRAILGGLLMGPAGAIVGGLTGMKPAKKSLVPDSIVLITYIENGNSEEQIFFSCKNEDTREVIDFFKKINISISEMIESDFVDNIENSKEENIIDSLERLAKLKKDGFLTDEEFDLHKKKLLGL